MDNFPMSTPLSAADSKVLNQIFDPESSPDAVNIQVDHTLPADPHIHNPALLKALRNEELEAVSLIESQELNSPTVNLSSRTSPTHTNITTNAADDDRIYHLALSRLSALIDKHPDYASAYNNRAQVRRWRLKKLKTTTAMPMRQEGREASASSFPSTIPEQRSATGSGNAEDADTLTDLILRDLRTAIDLSTPRGSARSTAPRVAPVQGKVLALAWTQRGAVLLEVGNRGRKEDGGGKDNQGKKNGVVRPDGKEGDVDNEDDDSWRNWDAMKLEEESSRAFYMAGLYGSKVGRQMAVRTNPYARLCAGIVREAMGREGW